MLPKDPTRQKIEINFKSFAKSNDLLNESSQKLLNESWLRMFGANIQAILKAMFGGFTIPVTVRGSEHEIRSFSETLAQEKRYMDAYHQYGLDNPMTYRSKFQLNKSISDFERKTGIPWPLH